MRLYSFDLSPFAARCRFVIYTKALDIEIVPPPEGGPRSDAYRVINPIGKVPALVLENGQVIPESEVIAEYLEERFPTPPLLPRAPEERALVRLIARLGDLYLTPPTNRLVGQLRPEMRDEAVIRAALAEVEMALGQIEHFMTAGGWAVGREKSLADAALIPLLFGITRFLPQFDRAAPLAGHPRLDIYWRSVGIDPVVTEKVTREMQAGLDRMLGRG